jgi:hypothetical protein
MYYVAIKSMLAALRGFEVGWGKLERKATVSPLPDPSIVTVGAVGVEERDSALPGTSDAKSTGSVVRSVPKARERAMRDTR